MWDISSMNLRQIWVFPIPPIPQRRHEYLDISLLVTWWLNIFSSLSSTSCRPVKIGLELGFWVTGMFICTPPVLAGRIVFCPEYKISTKITDKKTTTMTYCCKRATSDEDILGIWKEIRPRLLSLLIVSDSQKHFICISNSQRGFVLLSWLALWHQERWMNFPPDGQQKQPPKWRP